MKTFGEVVTKLKLEREAARLTQLTNDTKSTTTTSELDGSKFSYPLSSRTRIRENTSNGSEPISSKSTDITVRKKIEPSSPLPLAIQKNLMDIENQSLIFENNLKRTISENRQMNSSAYSPMKMAGNDFKRSQFTSGLRSLSPVLSFKQTNSFITEKRLVLHKNASTDTHTVKPFNAYLSRTKSQINRFSIDYIKRKTIVEKMQITFNKINKSKLSMKDISNQRIFPQKKYFIENARQFFSCVKCSDTKTVEKMLKEDANHVFQFDDVK